MSTDQTDNVPPPMPGSCTPKAGNDEPCGMAFSDLPDDARLLVMPCNPPLNADQAAEAKGSVDKLFANFAKEGRINAHGCEVAAEGRFLLIGWIDNVHPLSGCSHDKVNRLVTTIGERSGSTLLGNPPIIIEGEKGLEFMDRPGFRKLVEDGMVSAETQAWDHTATSVGDWRRGALRPIAEHWLAPVYQRIVT